MASQALPFCGSMTWQINDFQLVTVVELSALAEHRGLYLPIQMCAYVWVYKYIYLYICMCVHAHINTYICIYVCICACMCVCLHVKTQAMRPINLRKHLKVQLEILEMENHVSGRRLFMTEFRSTPQQRFFMQEMCHFS